MNLLDLACQQRWAMRPESLRGLLDILARESLDPELARQIREDRASRPSALAAVQGARLDNARRARVRDGVALIEVVGPIVRRADMFSEISGASSADTLAYDLQTALSAPNVRAVLLVVDSPGGEVTGIHELAGMIEAANKRKPVWAYVEGLGASAAYWLSAASERIIVDDTAVLGSIGVVMAVRDPSKAKSDQIEIVSSQSPKKRPDVATEAGRAQLQALVDATAEVFIADVARLRGVDEQTVMDEFGQGDVFVGRAAVQAGLADALGTFEQTLLDIQIAASERGAQRPMRAAQETPMDWKAFWRGMFGAAAEVEGAPVAALLEPRTLAEGAPVAALLEPRTLAEGEMLAEGDLPEGTTIAAAAPLEPVASAAQAQAELEATRAELAQLKAAQAQAEAAQRDQAAVAWAEGEIAAKRATPADHEHLLAVYRACAQSGALPALTALSAQRPAHRLTSELLPAPESGVIEAAQGARARMTPERRRQLLQYAGETAAE